MIDLFQSTSEFVAQPKKRKWIARDLSSCVQPCSDCGVTKPYLEFYREAKNKRNGGYRYTCKACDSARRKVYDANLSPEKRKKRYQNHRRHQQRSTLNKAVMMLNGIKERCKKNGRVNEISRDYLHAFIQLGVCAATGFKFRYGETKGGRGGIRPFTPSVDCIDPDGGYTYDNVQIVCSMYNVGKSHHDEIDFIAMCMAVAERNADNIAARTRMLELRE